MNKQVQDTRDKIAERVPSFVTVNNGILKLLLICGPPGFGKTRTTNETVTAKNLRYIYFGPTIKQVNDEVAGPFNLIQLKGIEKECRNPEKIKKFLSHNLNVEELFCKDKCEHYDTCKYYLDRKKLEEEPQSFCSTHHILQHNYIDKLLEKHDYDCIVIDEAFINNLKKITSITRQDLTFLSTILKIIQKNKPKYYNEKFTKNLYLFVHGLLSVLDSTRDKGLSGLSFIERFVVFLKNHDIDLENINWMFDSRRIAVFRSIYLDIFKECIETSRKSNCKDVLYDVFAIAEKCIKYNNERPDNDVCLPFYSEVDSKKFIKQIVNVKMRKRFPKIPIICLDAYGDKEILSRLFNCDVEVLKADIETDANVIQITDGFYWKSSLDKPDTRKLVFRRILFIVLEHLKRGEKMINIITYKSLLNRENKNNLIDFLKERRVDLSKIRFRNFETIKGLNEMKDDKTLIILGTPEPNFIQFKKKIEVLYEGETRIGTDKIEESKSSKFYRHNYRYVDSRYNSLIRMERENVLLQCIGRLRSILDSKGKTVYLFSMCPLPIKTEKWKGKVIDFYFDPASEEIDERFKLMDGTEYVFLEHFYEGDTKKNSMIE